MKTISIHFLIFCLQQRLETGVLEVLVFVNLIFFLQHYDHISNKILLVFVL